MVVIAHNYDIDTQTYKVQNTRAAQNQDGHDLLIAQINGQHIATGMM